MQAKDLVGRGIVTITVYFRGGSVSATGVVLDHGEFLTLHSLHLSPDVQISADDHGGYTYFSEKELAFSHTQETDGWLFFREVTL